METSFPAANMDRVFWEVPASAVATHPYVGMLVRFVGQAPTVERLRRGVAERLAGLPSLAVELDSRMWCWTPVPSVDLTTIRGAARDRSASTAHNTPRVDPGTTIVR